MKTKKKKVNRPNLEKLVYTIPEIMKLLNISRNAAYVLAHSKQFKIVYVGSGIRIPKNSFDSWLVEQGGNYNG